MITTNPFNTWTKEEVMSYMGVWKYNSAKELREIIDIMREDRPLPHRLSNRNIYKTQRTPAHNFSDILKYISHSIKTLQSILAFKISLRLNDNQKKV